MIFLKKSCLHFHLLNNWINHNVLTGVLNIVYGSSPGVESYESALGPPSFLEHVSEVGIHSFPVIHTS